MKDKHTKTHASLFSGIGAADLAAEWMGWENAFWCEIDEFPRKILSYWFPKSKGYGDIKQTDFTEWRDKIDVLTGGFPCQPYSVAGKRKGQEDDRYLWPEMLRAIREIRPTWIVGENVAGITSMVQSDCEVRVENQETLLEEDNYQREIIEQEFTIEYICKSLEQEGYSVQPVIIPACGVGAPHRRERIWFIANRSNAGSQSVHEGWQVCANQSEPSANSCCERCSDGRDNREERQIYHNKERSDKEDKPEWEGRKHRNCEIGENPANSDFIGLQGGSIIGEHNQKEPESGDQSPFGRIRPKWEKFPAQSPVCGGDDGISMPNDTIAFFEERNRMDRNHVIYDSLKSGKLNVNHETGEIYSTSIRGHEGEHIALKGSMFNGHIVHTISFNGVKKQCSAHQIVWISANGLYDKEKYKIDHINGDRKDNRISNLRLVACEENIANQKTSDANILPIEDRIKICELFYAGHMNISEIAEDFNISKSEISNIVRKFDADNIATPFGRWRKGSIKGLGNSMVPQVMYEIFKAIETVEKQ